MYNFSSKMRNKNLTLTIENKNIQFDHAADIYHTQYKFGTKPIILKISNCKSSKIFISSENSLGIFFLKKNVKIYITRPLFKILLYRLKELQNIFIDYDEILQNDKHLEYELVNIFDANIKRTKKMINFISFDEILNFSFFQIQVISANTFLGFCNFIIKFNHKKIGYFTSYSDEKRISIKSQSQKLDFLFINNNSELQSKEFSKFEYDNSNNSETNQKNLKEFEKIISQNTIKIIPLDFTSIFYEIILHILSLSHKNQIFICNPNKKKLIKLLNQSGKFHNQKLRSDLHDLIPYNHKNIHFLNNFSKIIDIPKDSIIFCSVEEFLLISNSVDRTFYWKNFFSHFFDESEKNEKNVIENLIENNNNNSVNMNIKEIIKNIDKKTRESFLLNFIKNYNKNDKKVILQDHIILNINNYDFIGDHNLNFQLKLSIHDLIKNFQPEKIILENGKIFYNQFENIQSENNFLKIINEPKENEINLENEYSFVYLIDTQILEIKEEKIFIKKDFEIKNRIIKKKKL